MKAIIFDVDNTLIDWKDEFVFALRNLLKEIYPNISEDEILKIDKVIDENEKYLKSLNKKEFLEYIRNKCKINFSDDFVDKLIIAQGNCVYEDEELNKTIEYLSSKYDLYVISNWFTKTQQLRLEKMGILKYFKNVWGADTNYFKPDVKAFDVILKHYNKEECVYIGDKLDIDIIPALNFGMNAIWKTNEVSDKYKTIRNINELRNIF